MITVIMKVMVTREIKIIIVHANLKQIKKGKRGTGEREWDRRMELECRDGVRRREKEHK